MGRVKGSGGGGGEREEHIFFLPSSFPFFALAPTLSNLHRHKIKGGGYHNMNINKHLFRLPKIRLYCRLRNARPLLQGLAFAREDLDDCQLGLEQATVQR